MTRTTRPLGILLLACVGCAAFLLAVPRLAAAADSQGEAPQYVGSQTCMQCHDQQAAKLRLTSHGLAMMDSGLVASRVGCESCHGPGSLHAAAAGDTSNAGYHTILNFKKASPERANNACRSCHKGAAQMYWDQSTHARQKVKCVTCHSAHDYKSPGGTALLAKAGVNQLCTGCHTEKRMQINRNSHMPLREGPMTCVSCHNPHGSPGPRMVKANTTNELCVSCHADKRGPFLWEHAPVREDCLNCHDAHGASTAKMLVTKPPYLCQRCHIGTRHPSTLYDQTKLNAYDNRMVNRGCVNCHSQVHGSNHPSGQYFLR